MSKAKNKNKKPCFLFIVVGNMRYPAPYESEELATWRKQHLKFYETLCAKGKVFHKHYANNTSVGSRATLQTGHHSNVHGCSDGNMLKQNTVPTMGNYFNTEKYKTIFKGKWSISDVQIRGGNGKILSTFDGEGRSIKEMENLYLERNKLLDYGYEGWIGPDACGNQSLNTGSSCCGTGRDQAFLEQTLAAMDELKNSKNPWFLSVNLVGCHDINFYDIENHKDKLNFKFDIDETLPNKLFNDSFEPALVPVPNNEKSVLSFEDYTKCYYTLMKKADQKLVQIWNKLTKMPDYSNTIVVLTSDQGELFKIRAQDISQPYEEKIHIPLIISTLDRAHEDINNLTSHVDILPTFLELANIDQELTRKKLSEKFSLAVPLSGQNMLQRSKKSKAYFYEDNAWEMVTFTINCKQWKLSRFIGNDGVENKMYNITDDPTEKFNLYGKASNSDVQKQLHKELNMSMVQHRSIENAF